MGEEARWRPYISSCLQTHKLLPQPPEGWDYRPVSPNQDKTNVLKTQFRDSSGKPDCTNLSCFLGSFYQPQSLCFLILENLLLTLKCSVSLKNSCWPDEINHSHPATLILLERFPSLEQSKPLSNSPPFLIFQGGISL